MIRVMKYLVGFRNGHDELPKPSDLSRQIVQRMFPFIAAGFLGVILLSGCGTIQVRAGSKPNVNALQALQPGKSTKQEVLAALGKPEGRGRSMLPWQDSPRILWSYYYEEGAMNLGGKSDDRRIFLFVFFKGDRFDGYMWFSSLKPSQ